MTNLESRQALARKLDISYTDIANNGLFTDSDLQAFIQTGVQIAWDLHPWDFTEGAKVGTLTSGNITAGYVDYPADMVTGGAHHLVVNGEEFPPENKLQYRDYLFWKQNNTTSTDKYWSEYKRFIFMNMLAAAEGQTFDVYGKLRSTTLSGDSDLLPFSTDTDNQEDSGNSAIVDLAFAEALESEKKKQPEQAAGVRTKALSMLDMLWKPMASNQSLLQPKDRPFFITPDYFGSGNRSSRNNIGNF